MGLLGSTPQIPARKRQEIGLWLFLASIAVFFLAAFVAFLIIFGRHAAGAEFGLPIILWVSTGVLLASSVSLHLALLAVRREKPSRFKRLLIASLILGIGFCILQTFGMGNLLAAHKQAIAIESSPAAEFAADESQYAVRPNSPFATSMWFVLIHAVHVAGGLVFVGMVCRRAFADAYDHEYYFGVRLCTMYWHLLDIVWLAMMTVLLMAT